MRAIFVIFDFLIIAGGVFLVTLLLFFIFNKIKLYIMKTQADQEQIEASAHQGEEKYYCCDCEKVFYSSQSVKTAVGIYPCPYCSGNSTCLDTLQATTKNYK